MELPVLPVAPMTATFIMVLCRECLPPAVILKTWARHQMKLKDREVLYILYSGFFFLLLGNAEPLEAIATLDQTVPC